MESLQEPSIVSGMRRLDHQRSLSTMTTTTERAKLQLARWRFRHTSSRWHKLLLFAIAISCCHTTVSALEATWTPNDSDAPGGGPLPLSQQKRQQLLQLEDAIRQSPDPAGTLEAAAKSIQMEPQDLLQLLERNHNDMQQAAIEARTPKTTKRMAQGVSTAAKALAHWAQKHPRQAVLLATLLVASTYILQTASHSGTILSSRRSVISRGPTALFRPPTAFVKSNMLLHADRLHPLSPVLTKVDHDAWKQEMEQLPVDSDGSTWHKRKKGLLLKQAASSQVTVDLSALVTTASNDDDNDEKEEVDNDELLAQEALVEELAWEQAAFVLRARTLTERVVDRNAVRLVTPSSRDKNEDAVLVVNGLGDYNRYGMVGLRMTDQQVDHESHDCDDELFLSLATWADSHFDGRLHISISRVVSNHNGLVVRVYLLVPKGGTSIARKAAIAIVEQLSQSISESIRIRTLQSVARRHQSSSFAKAAKERAQSRRKSRQTKEQLMEEMATDRRRRWQRSNPNSGHYRPSGERMRSPNNAMY